MSARVLLLDWPADDAPTVESALAYARCGQRVFPLAVRSKLPLIPKAEGGNGVHDATRDEQQIRSWWQRWPEANVAISCSDRLAVIDVDHRNGGHESFDKLMVEHRLPATPIAVSGSGDSFHCYFVDPTGRVRSSSGKLGPGLDVKAEGGYVVAPPSVHPSGGRYVWTKSARLGIPELPTSLIDVLAPAPVVRAPVPRPERRARAGSATPYGQAALDNLVDKILSAPPGTPKDGRHDTLYKAAARCGDLALEGHLDAGAAYDALVDAGRSACAGEWRDDEIERTVGAGMLAARKGRSA